MLTFLLHKVSIDKCGCGNIECKQAGKHPAERWKELPADRPELKPTADRGVGIATGERSGVFVIDLDTKGGVDGVANFRALANDNIPPTYVVATPTGGFHFYFKYPGFRVYNSASKLAPGVDVRGDGGFVVAPGSPHKNGGRYAVAADLPIAEAPAWLLDALQADAPAEIAAPAAEVEARVRGIPREWRIAKAKSWLAKQAPAVEGQGGDAHTWKLLARASHEWCLTDSKMINEAFLDWNARCEPPWGGQQWAHKISDVLNKSTIEWSKTIIMAYRHENPRANLAEQLNVGTCAEVPTNTENKVNSSASLLGFEFGCWTEEPPPIDFLVEGLVPRASVGMFYGRADALKTWLLFSLGLAVASGKPWLDHYVVKRALKVGIVDYETGRANVDRRLYMLGAGGNANLGRKSFAKLKPNAIEFWEALATENFDLVIIDSLRRSNPGANENESEEAIRPLELAAEFAELTGASVLFIHHAKKDSADATPEFRGSGAIEDQVDISFSVKKTDVSIELKKIEIRCQKPGDMRSPTPFDVEIKFDDIGRKVSLKRIAPEKEIIEPPEEKIRKQILDTLKQSSYGIDKDTLFDLVRGKTDLKREVLAGLLVTGIVNKHNLEGRYGKTVFTLAT